MPFNATGTYLLDNLRFVSGQAGGCGDFVEGNILAAWTSGGDSRTTTLSALTSGAVAARRRCAPSPTRPSTSSSATTRRRRSTHRLPTNFASPSVALNTTPGGWQIAGPVLVAEDTNGARIQFEPRRQMLGVDGNLGQWPARRSPAAPRWITTGGPVNWSSIRAIEIHADTFDDGFTLDVDAVSFERTGTTCECTTPCGTHGVCNQSHLYCDCQLGWGGSSVVFVLRGRVRAAEQRVRRCRTTALRRCGRTRSARRPAIRGWRFTTTRSRP